MKCLTKVRQRLFRAGSFKRGTRVFLFGSAVKGKCCPSDVDLLIVYDGQDDLQKLREVLLPLQDEYPLDFLFASVAEELELQLIKVLGAEPILEANAKCEIAHER